MSPYSVLDDGFHGHPKILRGGPIVELLQLRAIAHCNRYLTDGVIDQAVVPTLTHGLERLEIDGTPAPAIDWVAELLKLGLWERHDRGYLVHDYLAFNRSRQEVEWLKTQKRAAGSKGGQASAQARATPPAQPSATARAQAPASIQASAQAGAAAGAQALHGTTSTPSKETTSRHVASTVNGSTTPDTESEPAPTDEQVRALIRATAAKLSDGTPDPTSATATARIKARLTAQHDPPPAPEPEEPPF